MFSIMCVGFSNFCFRNLFACIAIHTLHSVSYNCIAT